ncbi:hypothetical protein UFOVP190_15 [uncultured Caudovirales phage]|uniref:Uncharacterized protein n=1 Tax=uncultured Caudovirales phage TaxID=2100421 RepID=A0A6J7WGD3_9CAUD|nr:hypothetical protein UFOVP190_15 [uncultured Caudovirales phage]
MKTEKYNFDRKWYEFDTFDVETRLHDGYRIRCRKPSVSSTPTQEIIDWCIQHFGPAGMATNESRWFWSKFVFNFRDEADYMFFKLRWA